MDLQRYLERCTKRLGWALEGLGASPSRRQLQRMARLIVEGTTGPHRHFHTPEHLFMVAGEDDPVEVLAGLYHDLLYVQVDRSIFLNLACAIAGVVRQDGDHLAIREAEDLPALPEVSLVIHLFGFEPGQALEPQGGQNEFLSAMVAARELSQHLSLAEIARVAACIELTIPFRPPRKTDGARPVRVLLERLEAANARYRLGMSPGQLRHAMKQAVRLCVRDVAGFGYDVDLFMDNTWSLLPETNHFLQNPQSYSVTEYRASMQRSFSFFSSLRPEDIYNSFDGEPGEDILKVLTRRATYNLEVGQLYLASKLVALAVLEALAARVGQHTPVATLLQEDPAALPEGRAPEPYPVLGQEPAAFPTSEARDVYALLARGRTQETSYDLNNSPIAAHFFSVLGAAGIRSRLGRAQSYFEGEITADEMIQLVPAELVAPIKERIAEMMRRRMVAVSRAP